MFADDLASVVFGQPVKICPSSFFGGRWLEIQDARSNFTLGSAPMDKKNFAQIFPFWLRHDYTKVQRRRVPESMLPVRRDPRQDVPEHKARGLRGVLVNGLRRLASAIESYGISARH